MADSRTPRARRIDRWLERWSAAFVMEVRSADGSTVIIGLDPSGLGPPAISLDDPVVWPPEPFVVPDDLRDLVP